MTKDKLLIKIQQIKQSTQSIIDGGNANAEATRNVTENQRQPNESI